MNDAKLAQQRWHFLKKNRWIKEANYKRIATVWFWFYRFQNQVKLAYIVSRCHRKWLPQSQENGFLLREEEDDYKVEHRRQAFISLKMFYFLNLVLVGVTWKLLYNYSLKCKYFIISYICMISYIILYGCETKIKLIKTKQIRKYH